MTRQIENSIPYTVPHSAAVEERLSRFVKTLGRSWTLTLVADECGAWIVCLRRERGGRVAQLWQTTLATAEREPAALEVWLRALVRRVQDELDLEVAMKPVGRLSPIFYAALQRAVVRHDGGRTRDGYIVVPRRARPAFLREVDGLGITLEVAAWDKGRRPVYAATLTHTLR